MRNISFFVRLVLTCAALVSGTAALASRADAQSGKMTGIVTDAESGQPVEGVQVVLQGTGYGAVTQSNGRYFILAIPPGSYTVQARRIGYQTQQTTATILIDVTREQSFKLAAASTQLAAVQVVESRENLVELTQTGTTNQITTAELEALPVRTIKDALTLQAGFQEVPTVSTDLTSFTASRRNGVPQILIRGGRGGETLTLIDDIPVNNFLFGGPTLDLTQKAVENVATFRGGLEPQYGNALSGVVSIATKEGGTNLAGSIEYETSRFGGAVGNTRDELRGYDFVDGYLSGPVPATKNKLRFVVAGRTQNEAGSVLEYDNKIYDPFKADTTARDPYTEDLVPGWRAQGYRTQRDVYGKLTMHFTPTTKLSVGVIDFEREAMSVPFDWLFTGLNLTAACTKAYAGRYGSGVDVADVCNTLYEGDRTAPTGRPVGDARYEFANPAVITQRRQLFTGRFEQTLGRFNYRIVGGYFDQSRETCATFFSGVCIGERIADTNFTGRFVTYGVTSQAITPTEGTDEIAGNDKLLTRLGRVDAQLQATDHHNLAAGIFYQGHDIAFREVKDIGLNNIFLQPSDYAAKPWDAAAYIQDRIEYDFLTVRVGARFDYGRAGGKFLNDPLDPTNGTTLITVCNDPTAYGLPADFARFVDDSGRVYTGTAACQRPEARSKYDSAVAVAFRDDMSESTTRTAFSPRLGLSFPVTERSSAFFNFGVYYQNPLYNNVYQGTGIGTALEGTRQGPAFSNGTYVGNPRLRAEQTSSYEMGYVAEFARNYSVQVVAFSKDQSGLTGIRQGGIQRGTRAAGVFDPGVTYGTNRPNYTILVNQDYQTVRGLELELRRRLAGYWSGRINYGYSQATNNASAPDLEDQKSQEGDIPARSEIRADIDQRHSLNGSLTFQVRDEAPKFRFAGLFRNTTASLTARLASGYPYTPALTFTGSSRFRLERNSGTAPTTFRMDFQAQKDWNLANVRYGAFLRLANLLDARNCAQVFATTGNCEGGTSPQARLGAGNFTGESEGTTFYDRPQYISERRSVNAGVRISF